MKKLQDHIRREYLIYVLIIGLFLTMGIVASTYICEHVRQRQNVEIMSHLRTEATEFEGHLKSINSLLTLKYQKVRTRNIVDIDANLTNLDRYDIVLAMMTMGDTNVGILNGDCWPITEVMLYFTKSRITITSATMYTIGNLCSIYFDIDQTDFESILSEFLLSDQPQRLICLKCTKKEITVFLRKFTLLGSKEKIVGLCLLDNDLFSFDALYGGAVYITTENDLTCCGDPNCGNARFPNYTTLETMQGQRWFNIQKEPYMLMWLPASEGYKIAIALPKANYDRDVNLMRLLVFAAVTILCLAACFFLYRARRRYTVSIHQISELLQQGLPQNGNGVDSDNAEIEQIRNSLAHLILQNSDLQQKNVLANKQMENNYTVMRNSFVRMLILGKVETSDLDDMLRLYKIDINFEKYRVMLIQIVDHGITPEEADQAKQMLLVAISSTMESSFESCIVDDYTVGILFMYHVAKKAEFCQKVRNYTEYLTASMRDMLNVHISTGLGRSVHSIGDCLFSYYAARIVLLCSTRDGLSSLSRAGAISETDNNQLMHILHALEQGETQLCMRLFDGMFQSADDDKFETTQQRTNAIVLFNLFDDIVNGNAQTKKLFANNDAIHQRLASSTTFDDILAVIREMFESACNCIAGFSENRNKMMVDRAIQIIREKYADANLSQTEIADDIGVNASTLSAQFKEITGSNMSIYIRNLRVNRVKELLVQTKLTLEEIADRSGFNSLKTMYRVFKVETNTTPGQYRDMGVSKTVEQ